MSSLVTDTSFSVSKPSTRHTANSSTVTLIRNGVPTLSEICLALNNKDLNVIRCRDSQQHKTGDATTHLVRYGLSTDCVSPNISTASNTNRLQIKLCANENKNLNSEEVGRTNETSINVDTQMLNEMKFEENRLRTFQNGWPLNYIAPNDLAAVGFFYLQTGDKVQCAFCCGIVMDWKVGDEPLVEHALHFPFCPYLLNTDVGNVPISGSNQSQKWLIKDSFPENLSEIKRTNNTVRNLRTTTKCHYPSMANFETRKLTFYKWPSAAVKPDRLAEAGLFYRDVRDITTCFSCGGTLGNWETGDDPWIEHATHFPCCPFVKQTKGEHFIQTCQNGATGILVERENTKSNKMDELMDSKIVTDALEIFPSKLVRNAVEKQLKEAGSGFENLQDLCDSILEIQESLENTETVPETKTTTSSVALKVHNLCKICMDQEIGIVFLPCGHMLTCPKCALAVTKCPLCRKPIASSIRAYIS